MSMETQPKLPDGPGWTWSIPLANPRATAWQHESGLQVISAIEHVPITPGAIVAVPHFHVSAIHRGGPGMDTRRTVTDEELERVRAAFDMGGAEEDNHGRGIARHLWLQVGKDRQPECACKQDEQRVVEGARVRHDTPQDQST